jgi:hypothetical protein
MSVGNNLSPEKYSMDIMLTEYKTLQELRSELITIGENRVNFFLAIVSGGLVGLSLLPQASPMGEINYLITGAVLIGFLILGFITLARTIERSIGVKKYARGMNRIRRYFAQLDPHLHAYFLLPISDDRPTFQSIGWLTGGAKFLSLANIVAIINGILVSVTSSLYSYAIVGLRISDIVKLSILSFSLVYSLEFIYITARLSQAEKQTEVRFSNAKEK